jgi:hypothetical protein
MWEQLFTFISRWKDQEPRLPETPCVDLLIINVECIGLVQLLAEGG